MGLHVTSADLHNDLLSMYRGNRLADAVRIVGGSRWQQSGATSEQSGSHTVRGIRFRGARWLYWDHDPAAHLVNAAHLGKPRAASIWSDSDCPRESAQESPDASPAKRVRPLDEGAGGRDAAGRHIDGAAWAMLQRILARLPSPPQLNAPVLQRCCAKW